MPRKFIRHKHIQIQHTKSNHCSSIRSEIEIGTRSHPPQKRRTESQPIRRQIKLQQIILQLIPTDHNRRPRIYPSIQKPQTQNVVVHGNHRIRPCNRPHRITPLQNKVNVRHRRPHPRAPDILAAKANLERRHGGDAGYIPGGGFLDVRGGECSIYGGFEKGVGVDGADFCSAVTVTVDCEKGGVDVDGVIVDSNGVDADEVLG